MIDLQKAIELREAGHTYPQIAHKLGISKAWCAANLKGVHKGKLTLTPSSESDYRAQVANILEEMLERVRAL
jgi:hypothetical protein